MSHFENYALIETLGEGTFGKYSKYHAELNSPPSTASTTLSNLPLAATPTPRSCSPPSSKNRPLCSVSFRIRTSSNSTLLSGKAHMRTRGSRTCVRLWYSNTRHTTWLTSSSSVPSAKPSPAHFSLNSWTPSTTSTAATLSTETSNPRTCSSTATSHSKYAILAYPPR